MAALVHDHRPQRPRQGQATARACRQAVALAARVRFTDLGPTGIYAASKALRHANIAITEACYVATRKTSMPPISQLLAPTNIIPMKGVA